ELCFCIVAIQSKARASDSAVAALRTTQLLWSGGPDEIATFLRHRTRFHNHKAAFIVRARERFFPQGHGELAKTLDSFPSSKDARGWLVREVHGLGLKEASHFLRNTGRGEDLAILDRHILRNLIRHGANRRDLPWRRSRDPYRILVAEYLLQRTRIASGTPYYERFLERFPTVRDLAAAPFDDVLTVWEGLGFYGRARNLHVAAQAVVERHHGMIPQSYHDLMALPGIGPYTAGAVASIAFGIPVPAIDGNVIRVIARLFRIRENVTSGAVRRRITEIAGKL